MTNYVEDIMKEIYVGINGEMVNLKDIKPYDLYKNLDINDMPNERWVQFEESKYKKYQISSKGRVKSISKKNDLGMIMKQQKDTNGYLFVEIKNSQLRINRVVAQSFIENVENKAEVNHKNISNLNPELNKLDNRVENLEWNTKKENVQHAYDTGLHSKVIPVVILDSNGELISKHVSLSQASRELNQKSGDMNGNVAMIENRVVMTQEYYNSLSGDEIFTICTDMFLNSIGKGYVVDGQYIDTGVKTAQLIGCSSSYVNALTKDKLSAIYNGHTVSRLKNMIGVGG